MEDSILSLGDKDILCSICRTEEAPSEFKCGNHREPHHFCMSCFRPYLQEFLTPCDDPIPCPMWREYGQSCECTAIDGSVVRAVLGFSSEQEEINATDDSAETVIEESDNLESVETPTLPLDEDLSTDAESSTSPRSADEGSTSRSDGSSNQMTRAEATSEMDLVLYSGNAPTRPHELVGNVAYILMMKTWQAVKQAQASKEYRTRMEEHDQDDENHMDDSLAELLSYAIDEAFRRGQRSACPQCGSHSSSDDISNAKKECTALFCCCSWCPFCGRVQNGSYCITCSGQQTRSMGTGPGLGSLGYRGLSSSLGNLDDFFRRKTLCFLKKIRDSVSPMHWQLLQCQLHIKSHGSIPWAEVGNATVPTYGFTLPGNIAWENDMDDVLLRLQKALLVSETNVSRSLNDDGAPSESKQTQVVARVDEEIAGFAMFALAIAAVFFLTNFHQRSARSSCSMS